MELTVNGIELTFDQNASMTSELGGRCMSLWREGEKITREFQQMTPEPPILPTGDYLLENGMAELDDVFYEYQVDNAPVALGDSTLHVISTISSPDNLLHAALKGALPIYAETTNFTTRTLMVNSFREQIEKLRDELDGFDLAGHQSLAFDKKDSLTQFEATMLFMSLLLDVNIGVMTVNSDGDLEYVSRPPFKREYDHPSVLLMERYSHYEPIAIQQGREVLTVFPPDHPLALGIRTQS